MNLTPFFKSVLEQDVAAVVLCNLEHEIIYMNPASVENYHKWGGAELVGKSLLNCHNPNSVEKIRMVINWFQEDETHNRVFTFYNEKQNKDVYMIALRDDERKLIGYYEKHEYRNLESAEPYAM